MKIPINKIKPNPLQPRKEFDQVELQELADSIKENGLLQPIAVEEHNDHYVLVAGERRLKAHELLGLTEIDAYLVQESRSSNNDAQLLISAIVENVQRVDMNPVEEARAYEQLKNGFGLSVKEIARKVGKHSSQIYNVINLLKYDPEIIEMIERKEYPSNPQLAFAIMEIPDRNTRLQIAERIKSGSLKIESAIIAAKKIVSTLTQKSDLQRSGSPAVELSRKRNGYNKLDADNPPTSWDIRSVTGGFPKWDKMFASANNVCGRCSLLDVASEENCGRCPLAEFLIDVVKP